MSRPAAPKEPKLTDVAHDVIVLEDRRWDLLRANDAEGIAELLADGLVYVHPGGTFDDKSSFLETLRSGTMQYREVQLSDRTVGVVGDTVVIVGTAEIDYLYNGTGRHSSIRYMAVWAREATRWVLAGWHATRPPAPTS
jgi:ketosteroid isomerase-like protein